jgi:hypothetical protein
MGKAPKEQVVTNKLDPAMEKYRNEVFDRARGVANEGYTSYGGPTTAGMNTQQYMAMGGTAGMADRFKQLGSRAEGMQFGSNLPGSMQFGGGADPNRAFGQFNTDLNMNMDPYQQAGARGAAALGGDASATRAMMNPYMEEVIGRLGGTYDKLRSGASNATADAATKSGSFGGSRHGIVEGQRLGEIDRAQGDATASLLQGGFNDAMGRAQGAAGLGLGAGGLASQHQLGAGGLRLGAEQAGADYGLGVSGQRLQGQGMDADYRLGAGAQRLQGQGMQLDANQQAMAAAQGQLGAYGQQFGYGDYQRQLQQQQLDYARNQFNERRGWGERGLNIMSGQMGGPYGNTQSEPLYNNKLGGALGGVLTGAETGSVIPGVGTVAGGIIGGLGGLFS